MKFIVRYWSSLTPKSPLGAGDGPNWLDYSIHAATKLGLHNALLAVHDRIEILDTHGGSFECAVFLEHGSSTEKLTQEMANKMFGALPHGAEKWLDIGHTPFYERPPAQQLPLFEYTHTPYDDLEEQTHSFDIDI